MNSEFWGMWGTTVFLISTLILLTIVAFLLEKIEQRKIDQLKKHSSDSIYEEAWNTLAMCFGERMQDKELKLMDSVLQSVKLDHEERQDENTVSEQHG